MAPAMLLLSFLVVLSGALLVRRAFPLCWVGQGSREVGFPVQYSTGDGYSRHHIQAVPFCWDVAVLYVLIFFLIRIPLVLSNAMVVVFNVLVNGGAYVLIRYLYVRHMYFIVVTLYTYTYTSTHI